MAITIAVMVVLVLAFFAWLHYSVQRSVNHQLSTLALLPCPSCGAQFEMEAAQRARQEYLVRCEEQREQRSDLRINFARRWEVTCPRCGARAEFHYETGSLSANAA